MPSSSLVRGGAGGHEQVEVVELRRAEPGLARRRGLRDREDGLAWPVLARRAAAASRPPPRARSPPAPRRSRIRGAGAPGELGERAAARRPDGTRFVPRWQSAESSPSSAAGEAAEPAPGDVLEEDALDGVARAEAEDLVARGLEDVRHSATR